MSKEKTEPKAIRLKCDPSRLPARGVPHKKPRGVLVGGDVKDWWWYKHVRLHPR